MATTFLDRIRARIRPAQAPARVPFQRELAMADPLRLFGPEDFPKYNPSDLVTRKGLEIFDQMMNDDQIKAALTFRRHAVIAAGWSVESPDGRPEDWEVTEFVRACFAGMAATVDRVLYNVLSSMAYGYSVTEKIYGELPDGHFKGKIGLAALKTRRPHEFSFKTDAFGNVDPNGILQVTAAGEVPLPRAKFVLFTGGDTFDNPYGHSELESAYRPWWISDNANKWLAIMLERFGIPPVGALYNPAQFSPAQLQGLKDALANLQSATSVLIPRGSKEGLEMWAPQLAGQVSSVFIPALEMLDRSKARALLMPGLLGVTPDQLGSMARARVVFDVFMLSVTFTQQVLADTVMTEQIIKPLVALNYGITEVPLFRFKELTDKTQNELMSTWISLLENKAVMAGPDDEEFIRNALEFPAGRDATKTRTTTLQPAHISAELIESGALTVNEIRKAYGLAPKKGHDELRPIQMVGGLRNSIMARNDEGQEQGQAPERGQGAGRDERKAKAGNVPGGEKEVEDDAEDKRGAGAVGMAETGGEELGAEEPGTPIDPASLSPAARRMDFAAIEAFLDTSEAAMIAKLDERLRVAWASLRASLTYDIEGLRFVLPAGVQRDMRALLRAAFWAGDRDCRAEVAKAPTQTTELAAADDVNWQPREALDYLNAKADFAVKGLGDRLTNIVMGEILEGLKMGLPFRETAARIDAALTPYFGAEGQPLEFRHLETIVRTVSTEAYNHGRMISARRLGKVLVPGMEYVSVIDKRTTPICRHLNGKRFRLDDPELARYIPPNHFRCRSILAPITIDIEPAPSEFITPEELAKAARLTPGQFGGDAHAKAGDMP